MFAVLMWFWDIVKSVLNAIAKTAVFAGLLIVMFAVIGMLKTDGTASNMVLELDLRKPMEDKGNDPVLNIGSSPVSVMDVVLGLDRAARDARVKGVFVRVGSGDLSVPRAQELRDAFKRFEASGKFVIAHSQGFNSDGVGDYLAVSAATAIWMQPVSNFFPAGTSSTTLFYKGLFDKLQAQPQFVQRYEYKNAANVYTQTDYTAPHREATGRVLQSWYDSAVAEIAADRKMTVANLTAALDASPGMAEDVKQKGLIDHIGYDDDAREKARSSAGSGAQVVPYKKYVQALRAAGSFGNGPRIALVHAAGDIVDGDNSGSSAFSNDNNVAGDTFAEAIREAAKDKAVRAIVLRVDSPGGSAIASDQILDALKKAHAAGKPIVVSMGSLAASGGYYISMAADKIVAEPGTLTGSIGVLWGKFSIGKTAELAGLEVKTLNVGENAQFLSAAEPWTDEQLKAVNAQADAVYADFTKKVAEGRKLPLARVQEIARGRVWTGADAKERGLVDELGGFWLAVDEAKKLAKIDAKTEVSFKSYPGNKGFLGAVTDAFAGTEAAMKALQGVGVLMNSAPVKALTEAAEVNGKVQYRAADLPQ